MKNLLKEDTNISEGYKIGSSLGFVAGLGYAFKVKSGFWKGWGYTILGSIAIGGIGAAIGYSIKKDKESNDTNG
jgi:hypothetical protein